MTTATRTLSVTQTMTEPFTRMLHTETRARYVASLIQPTPHGHTFDVLLTDSHIARVDVTLVARVALIQNPARR